MMEVVMTTEAIRHAKLQSTHQRQQTNTQLCTGRMHLLQQKRWIAKVWK